MKKLIVPVLSAVLLFAAGQTSSAQNAHETAVKFDKTNENAVVAEYDQPSDIVKEVLKDRLEKEGLGSMKSTKGFMRYSGVVWNSVSSDKLDAYFKVEGKKGKSTITVLVSNGYDNFVTSGSNARTIENVKAFLNSFGDQVAAYQKAQDIKAQEKAVKEAEEKQAKVEKEHQQKQKALDAEKQKLSNIKSSN